MPTFGDIYMWSIDQDFLVMFIVAEAEDSGWLGTVLKNENDTDYTVGDTDQWVGQGVTLEPASGATGLYWVKVG